MSPTALRFDGGRVVVDLQARRLTVAGSFAAVGGRSFDLLAALVAHRHRVMAKQDLLGLVWAGRVVEENNLQVRVAGLRRLLGRHAIVTVSGHGYKFALPQDEPLPQADAALDGPQAAAPEDVLLGRDALLAAALHLLASGSGRWLALCGPGGSGKTRLALHIAQTLPAQVADSACVALLAPVRAQAHVMAAIAGALGVHKPADEDGADRVLAFLRGRRLLLVLDNIEHLPELHRDIGALLAACPQLKVLTTSRTRLHLPLHLPDGQELAVPPLGLPVDDRSASILVAPAVALFLHRAAAAGRPLDRSAAALRAVAEICRRLDGLPLAIELAAARLRVLTPDALLSRLQDRLTLLKAGAGRAEAPPRHQTLRAALDWSRDLLTPGAQDLLGRLGVFVGGWSIDAAEAVAPPGAAVPDLLEELIDHHMVQRTEDVAGQPRYAMLETLREYALERLAASGDEAAVRAQHARHVAGLMRGLDRQLRSGSRAAALGLLRADRNNLRAALHWSIRTEGQAGTAAALVTASAWWWYFDDAALEGERWALACLGQPLAPPDRAGVLLALARAQVHGGRIQAGLAHAQQAEALALQVGDADTQAQALLLQAIPVVTQSRDQAVALMQRCVDLCRARGEPWDLALATAVLGMVLAWEAGAEDAAVPVLREARQRFLALGDQWCLTTASHHLARVAERQGQLALARRYAQEALDAASAVDYRFLMAGSQHHLARISLAQGDPGEALRWAGRCIRTRWDQGDRRNLLLHCRWLGGVCWRQGREREAITLLAVGSDELDEGLSLAATIMSPGDRREWTTAREAARAAWPPAAFDALWREARALPVEQALAQVGIDLVSPAMRVDQLA